MSEVDGDGKSYIFDWMRSFYLRAFANTAHCFEAQDQAQSPLFFEQQ